jgi:hypothetical protein
MIRTIQILFFLIPFGIFAKVTNGIFDSNITGWNNQNTPTEYVFNATEGYNAIGSLKIIADSTILSGVKTTLNTTPYLGAFNYLASVWVKGTACNHIQLSIFQVSHSCFLKPHPIREVTLSRYLFLEVL